MRASHPMSQPAVLQSTGNRKGGWGTMAFILGLFLIEPSASHPSHWLPLARDRDRTRTPSQPAAIAATDAQPKGRKQTSLEKKTLFSLPSSTFRLRPRTATGSQMPNPLAANLFAVHRFSTHILCTDRIPKQPRDPATRRSRHSASFRRGLETRYRK